jgi:hypothetical protein
MAIDFVTTALRIMRSIAGWPPRGLTSFCHLPAAIASGK